MELRIRAAARPMDLVAARESRWSLEPDSMVEEMLRAMDSLRTQLVRERAGTIRIRPESGSPRSGVAVVSPGAGATVRAPFEFFVFRGEEHDSLRQEMEVLNRLVSDLDQRLVIRARELERQARSVRRVPLPEDAELELLQREMESAARRSAELRAAMAEAARETAGFGYTARPAPRPDEPDPAQTGPEGFRPLSPYILGRNRVAGAQIIDLVPELAAYFEGVESGVLVVDVAPGTPAAISGLVPGDVVTRMDQVAVRSVEDLRFGVSQAGETLPLTLIRRGTSIQLLLRR